MDLNKISRSKRYKLAGLLKKNGFDRWRLVTNGVSTETGEDVAFFIELYIVNPMLSPSECVLGFKDRIGKTDADLQAALAGSASEKALLTQNFVHPSFVMVKVGKLAKGGKQINAYFPAKALKTDSDNNVVKVGTSEGNTCTITDSGMVGSVSVSRDDLIETPELMCNPGTMVWNLHYTLEENFFPNYRSKTINWSCFGARTSVNGVITFDGETYSVSKNCSYGYFDKNWGRGFSNPFLHLSSSNLTSNISGKKLLQSCFAVQGEFNKKQSVLVSFEGKKLEFHAGGFRKYDVVYECTQMPEDDDGIKLHWSVSMNDRKYYIDIDVFCKTDVMCVRDYEAPEGGRKVLKVIGGGSGIGELKLYRRVKRSLELIEDVHIANCLCEYGTIELPQT